MITKFSFKNLLYKINYALICFSILVLSSCQSISNPIKTAANHPAHTLFSNNSNQTWDELQHTSLTRLIKMNPQNTDERGWVDLAIISKKNYFQFNDFIGALLQWKNQYPQHPGNAFVPDDTALKNFLTEKNTSVKIAVILPLSGSYQTQGDAVRKGILSAQNTEFKNIDIKNIQFFDSAKLGVLNAYQNALSFSPDVMIGPLLKNEVAALKSQPAATRPLIALNYSDIASSEDFYEFGLSPNDESAQMALHAGRRGLTRALLIAPNDAWGKQQAQVLTDYFSKQGGRIVDTLYFKNHQTDFNHDIPRLLKIDAKKDFARSRSGASAQTLENQRRQDFDVIFMFAHEDEARAIIPLLRYYYINQIPIYTMSASLSVDGDAIKNVDLDNVVVCDIPWQSQSRMSSTQRFFEVGYDSLILSQNLKRLNQFSAFPIYAHTGALSLNAQHQIRRRVPCIRMTHGELGSSSNLPE